MKKYNKRVRKNLLCGILSLTIVFIFIVSSELDLKAEFGATLSAVLSRGTLNCGVNGQLPGFSNIDSEGNITGFDADFCRAIAAAVLGDGNAVEFFPVTALQRFDLLASGEIDVLIRNTTYTLSRDTELGINFAPPIFYDGQGFMVRVEFGISSVSDLDGATICVISESASESNLIDTFSVRGLSFDLVMFESIEEMYGVYDAGGCDAVSSDVSILAVHRLTLENPEDHVILPELISKEPLAPVVRHGDDQWYDIVKWVVYATFFAEEVGIEQADVDPPFSDDEEPMAEISIRAKISIKTETSILGDSLDFGEVEVGDEKTLSVTIRNIGNDTLTIRSILLENSSNTPFQISEAESDAFESLNLNEEIEILIQCAPTSSGQFENKLFIHSNDPINSIESISLTCLGISSPPFLPEPETALQVSSELLTFNEVSALMWTAQANRTGITLEPSMGTVSGKTVAQQTISIDFSGRSAPTIQTTQDWIETQLGEINETSQSVTRQELGVNVNIEGLAPGMHRGQIVVSLPGARSESITVVLNITEPVLGVSPNRLTFSSSGESSKTFQVQNAAFEPATSQEVTVRVNETVGSSTSIIVVQGNGQTKTVEVRVSRAPPEPAPPEPEAFELAFDDADNPGKLEFRETLPLNWTAASSSDITLAPDRGVILGREAESKSFRILYPNQPQQGANIVSNANWIKIDPEAISATTGSQAEQRVNVQINSEGLGLGTHRGVILLQISGAPTKTVMVEFTLTEPRLGVSTSRLEFGENDTQRSFRVLNEAVSPASSQLVNVIIEETFSMEFTGTITVNGGGRTERISVQKAPEQLDFVNYVPFFEHSLEAPQNAAATWKVNQYRSGQIAQIAPSGCHHVCSENDVGDDVLLHSGELFLSMTDLVIPSRGMPWVFQRSYRSGGNFAGPLGHNWEFNYNRRLVEVNNRNITRVQEAIPNLTVDVGDVYRMDGYSRADVYTRNADGSFTSPNGYYTGLEHMTDGTYLERDALGNKIRYAIPNVEGTAPMTSLSDRNGNTMQFEYDDDLRLVRVLDTLGRVIDYRYNEQGHLVEVEDFFSRSITFSYDENNNLTAVTSPSVTNTPQGNDFPQGKTERYTYSTSFADERLNHNLLTITAPNEVAQNGEPRIRFTYDVAPESSHLGAVLTQTFGGTNHTGVPAGGIIRYEYLTLEENVAPNDFNTPTTQTTVIDRNGNRTVYLFNQNGNFVNVKEFSNREVRTGDPEFYETRYEYNKDSEPVRTTLPEGNVVEYRYDSNNPDRFQQGNVLQTINIPDADRGGDQQEIRTQQTYEPIYNQLRTMVEPRGLDSGFTPQNGESRTSAERYTTTFFFDYQEGDNFALLAELKGVSEERMRELLRDIPMNLGDLNGDGITNQIAGNVVRTVAPTVNLLPEGNQAAIEDGPRQPIESKMVYNRFGQLIREIDPEGNVSLYEYYPENDPDGDGRDLTSNVSDGPFGYLKAIRQDVQSEAIRNSKTNPTPTDIQTEFAYDRVGNVIRTVDGRGIASEFIVNELNQVVQVISPTAHGLFEANPPEPMELNNFGYVSRIFYDFNDNVVLTQTEDRGNTSNVGGNPPSNELPFNVSNPDPMGGMAFVDAVIHYDILDNPVETISEVSNGATPHFLHSQFRYDSNENLVLSIQPEGNAHSTIFDERDLIFQATQGALIAPEKALLTREDPFRFDVRGGIPSTSTYIYDRNRNLINLCDAEDTDGSAENNCEITGTDRTTFLYDGFDRLVSTIDAVGNQSVTQYDPASNVIRTLVFGPIGGESPDTDVDAHFQQPISNLGVLQRIRQPLLQAQEYRYDELSRVFQSDQLLFVTRGVQTVRPPDVADGASDLFKGDITSNDANPIPGLSGINLIGRVSQRTEYDRNSRITFVTEDDGDLYRMFYDGVDRVIRTEDPEGNVVETAYDDNHNVIEVKETDVAQLPGLADEVFLTTYFYDSLNRVQRATDNVGQTHFFRYDSRSNMVTKADAQGPMNGEEILRRFFALGDLTVNAINGFGNVTRYSYDGISRHLTEEKILTESGSGDGIHIGADIFGVKTELPTPDVNQGGGDGIIRIGYTWDDNSLISTMIDDQGNVTLYLYDNLNRQVLETKGFTVETTPLNKERILGPRNIITPTQTTLNNPVSTPANLLNNQLNQVRTRLEAIQDLFPPLASRVDDAPPTTIVYGYDRDSHVLILEDENDSEVYTRFDAIDRPIAVRMFRSGQNDMFRGNGRFAPNPGNDPANPSTSFTPIIGTTEEDYFYDGLSRLVRATDNNNPSDPSDDSAITYAYDSLSRVIEETQQIGNLPPKAISSQWRAENLRSGLIYPSGRQLQYDFDFLDRLNTIVEQGNPTPIVDYDYIGTSRVLQRLYPQNGTRMTFLNDNNSQDVGYDGLRRVTQLRHLRDDNSLIVGFTHAYDRMNNKRYEEKLHDPGNSEMYRYDSVYRLIEFQRGQMNDAKTAIKAPTTLPNALKHKTWTLDGANNWTANLVVSNNENGLEVMETQSRQHTSFNEIAEIVEGDDSPENILSDDNGNMSEDERFLYEWDYKDRLKTITRKVDNQLVAIYSYDVNNRRIRKDVRADGLAEVTTATVHAIGWFAGFQSIWIWGGSGVVLLLILIAIVLRFIPQSQKLRLKRRLYQFSTRLWIISLILTFTVQVLPFTPELFAYAQTNDTPRENIIGITDFYYDGWQVLEEHNESGEGIPQYVYGNYIDEPLMMDAGNGEGLFYHQNTLSSTFALTNLTGFIREGYQYNPYGQQQDSRELSGSNTLNPYLFTGRRVDYETLLYYFRNRYYQSEQGRFLQRDPIGLWQESPNSLGNDYVFADNNPVMFIDPFGLRPLNCNEHSSIAGCQDNDRFEARERFRSRARNVMGRSTLEVTKLGIETALDSKPSTMPNASTLSKFSKFGGAAASVAGTIAEAQNFAKAKNTTEKIDSAVLGTSSAVSACGVFFSGPVGLGATVFGISYEIGAALREVPDMLPKRPSGSIYTTISAPIDEPSILAPGVFLDSLTFYGTSHRPWLYDGIGFYSLRTGRLLAVKLRNGNYLFGESISILNEKRMKRTINRSDFFDILELEKTSQSLSENEVNNQLIEAIVAENARLLRMTYSLWKKLDKSSRNSYIRWKLHKGAE